MIRVRIYGLLRLELGGRDALQLPWRGGDTVRRVLERFQAALAVPVNHRLVDDSGVQGDQGQLLTLVKGSSQELEDIYAGCRQPAGTIPVAPGSVFVLAGLMAQELFDSLCGRPKLLNRLLVVDLAGLNLSFLEV